MNRRLDIAFVVHDYHRHGGHSRYVAELARRYRHQHAVHVYCNRVDDSDTAGIQFHHVPAWRTSALASILSFVLPATLLMGHHDIVHAQGLCGLKHNIATAHLITPAWWQARREHEGRATWKGWLAETLITPLERAALTGSGVKRVIAVSRLTAADIARHHGRTRGVCVIPHGTDVEQFHPRWREAARPDLLRRLALPDTAVLALFAGNLQKGALAAVETVARVPGTHLLLASASDPTVVLDHAAKLGVADRVHMLGFSREPQLWMAAVDLLLFPTFFDTFGLVILEAMASALPVITTRKAGAADLVAHGQTGWLVDDPHDVADMAEGLKMLMENTDLRIRMGQAGRAVAVHRTWDAVADETMAVYRETVSAMPEMEM